MAGQAAQALDVELKKKPAAQAEHELAPVDVVQLPAAQVEHDVELGAEEKVPAAHDEHDEELGADEKEPASHTKQPVELANEPAGQVQTSVEPEPADKNPSAQVQEVVELLRSATDVEPGGHGRHVLSMYVLASHAEVGSASTTSKSARIAGRVCGAGTGRACRAEGRSRRAIGAGGMRSCFPAVYERAEIYVPTVTRNGIRSAGRQGFPAFFFKHKFVYCVKAWQSLRGKKKLFAQRRLEPCCATSLQRAPLARSCGAR